MNLQIVSYRAEHSAAVSELVLSIQREEFGFPITLEDQPDLQDVEGFFREGEGNFWVAIADAAVVGTIGLKDIGNRHFALRKMFVHSEFRGRDKGVALALLQASILWAESRGFEKVYLGTTEKFLAAQRFYEKNGFRRVSASELPAAFPRMAVDTVFFEKRIAMPISPTHLSYEAPG